jgi:hypothetical protein
MVGMVVQVAELYTVTRTRRSASRRWIFLHPIPRAKQDQAQPSTNRCQTHQIHHTEALKMLDLGVQITGILSGAFLTGQYNHHASLPDKKQKQGSSQNVRPTVSTI